MGAGEGDVGNKGIGFGRLESGVASPEIEEEPLERNRRKYFARIRDEVAPRDKILRCRERRVLESSDGLK
jgi:hypothetical protein